MIKDIWINLPVKNIQQSVAFFTSLGFSLNTQYDNSENSASLVIGDKKVVVMLFAESVFQGFIEHGISDTSQGTEVLFSIGAESREDVDLLAKNVIAAGGRIYSAPSEVQGWMYGCGFVDLDGHRWNSLFMDFSKMPQ